MNIDAKILSKILANQTHNTLKGSYTMIKIYPRDATIQYMQINWCDTPHWQIEE